MFMKLRNRFQGLNSASLCSLAARYDNPLLPRLAPIDSLKFQLRKEEGREGYHLNYTAKLGPIGSEYITHQGGEGNKYIFL
jgi:hypothetical protein